MNDDSGRDSLTHCVMSTDDMMSPINVNTNNLKLIQGIIVENLDGEGSLNSPSTLPSAPGQRCASPHTLDARSVVWWSVELNVLGYIVATSITKGRPPTDHQYMYAAPGGSTAL